jgi:hypothetical protein
MARATPWSAIAGMLLLACGSAQPEAERCPVPAPTSSPAASSTAPLDGQAVLRDDAPPSWHGCRAGRRQSPSLGGEALVVECRNRLLMRIALDASLSDEAVEANINRFFERGLPQRTASIERAPFALPDGREGMAARIVDRINHPSGRRLDIAAQIVVVRRDRPERDLVLTCAERHARTLDGCDGALRDLYAHPPAAEERR